MTLSTAALRATQDVSSGEVWLVLLHIAHSSLNDPIRIVRNTEDIVSNGETFFAYPFEITLPEDVEGQIPQVSLAISNVDKMLMDTLRSIITPLDVTVQVVLASSPDVIELYVTDFKLREVQYDATSITGTLLMEDVLNIRLPADIMNPGQYPGLF